jgi:hypothetical protein
MAGSQTQIDIYLEIGKKRTFAGAVEWPGWCRSGRNEESALQALFDYGPRYAHVLEPAGITFTVPGDPADFAVVERLEGNSTTDFGAPAAVPSADARPVDASELERYQDVLMACWAAFDGAVEAAAGRELRKGPRGGGRDTEGIIQHVLGAELSYLKTLGWSVEANEAADLEEALRVLRQAALEGLAAAARGELPTRGSRGGKRWTPRYFVRRAAWHVLDHAWEIEDRVL